MTIYITRRDGTKEPFNADRVNKSIERACEGFLDPISMVTQIATETQITMYDGITTEELDQATINAALQNVKDDIDYDKVAVRLLAKTIYRRVVGEYEDSMETLKKRHRDEFVFFVKRMVKEGRFDKRMEEKYDLEALADALRVDRDELFQYAGLSGLLNRYALKDKLTQKPMETSQWFFMRIAMGLAYNEENPTEWAKKFYNKMSKLEYVAGGSTNIAAGTSIPALSNCFLLEIQDDTAHIAKSVADVIMLSKASGGIGASITKLRASGSPLASNNGTSTGPTPFAKIFDTAIRAIQRGGKKKGALAFYMENWHIDFPDFVDWKHNAGDDYLRMRTANTAAWISDEFMKRVRTGDIWYMFDPKEVQDLPELYGSAFSKRYAEYIEMAEAGKLRAFKKVPAREQYRQMLVSLQTTAHPWMCWKDTTNLRALNNNTGTIHMSNLCTEICLPQDKDNIAVCNLTSLNLAAHISNKEVNWSKLEESVRFAVRQLDDLVDINVLPVKEAIKSDQENRAIGLGIMGFADAIEKLGMSYDSEHAWDFADRIYEFVSYMAIDESANLAQSRGSYKNFPGSMWSKGYVPVDTLKILEEDRGIPVAVSKESRHKGLNWNLLREKVKKGIRNATLMAVAPNANIGLLAGTTPGMDPRFAQMFSRNKISGKYLDINHNLVKDLKNMGLWERVKEQILESQGDISGITAIPQYVRDIYKTSFGTSAYAFIEVAARAQKWMDQSMSRNMYLETRDIDEIMKIYATAWEKGVKTTYYLHMKPRHTAEQSTTTVNKGEVMGKRGFGVLADRPAPAQMAQPSPFQVLEKQEKIGLFASVASVTNPLEDKEESAPSAEKAAGFSSVAKPVVSAPAASVASVVSKVSAIATVSSEAKASVPATASTATAASPQKKGFMSLADVAASLPVSDASASSSASAATATAVKQKPKVCPTDPAELAQCDSCQ